MRDHSNIQVVLYAYPLSLYAVRLLFPLILPRTHDAHNAGRRRSLILSCIWYCQLILSLEFVGEPALLAKSAMLSLIGSSSVQQFWPRSPMCGPSRRATASNKVKRIWYFWSQKSKSAFANYCRSRTPQWLYTSSLAFCQIRMAPLNLVLRTSVRGCLVVFSSSS